jgi:hypothetical protein
MVLDSVIHLISLGFRYAQSASFPLTLRNWKPQAHRSILTCCFATEPRRTPSFSPIQGLPRALAQVSTTEPDKVYPQWAVSFLAAYGTILYNDRRILVEPEVGPLTITPPRRRLTADFNFFFSVPRVGY